MTTQPAAEAATIRTVEHGEASALPEIAWGWRRTFAFGFTVACVLLVWRISERVSDIATLRMIARYALGLVALMALLYMAGASTEAITKLTAAWRTTRRETVTTGPAPASLSTTSSAAGLTTARVETPPAASTDGELPAEQQLPR